MKDGRQSVVLQGTAAPAASEASRSARGLLQDGRPPSLEAALGLALELGDRVPRPAGGSTAVLWELLASLGAVDLTLARVVEPHLDALTILDEAWRLGLAPARFWPDEATWGVYAAEGPERLVARRGSDGQWRLTGPKPWCSLAGQVSHALVTAWEGEGRRLFAVALRQPEVTVLPGDHWVARGLSQVTSTGLRFSGVPAEPVGDEGWYLRRPGFAWGGAGVAAIWFGGAVALARSLYDATTVRAPDQVALMHLGSVDAALVRSRDVLLEAAQAADAGATAAQADLVCQRVRQVVVDTAEEVLGRVGRALGPAPLSVDEAHARRVADLTLYLRQDHAERDRARLGSTVLSGPATAGWAWW